MEPEIVEPAVETVEEVIPPPVVEPPPAPSNSPEWQGPFEELSAKVTSLSDQLATVLNPQNPQPITEVIEPDESPVKKPWTHTNPFKRG